MKSKTLIFAFCRYDETVKSQIEAFYLEKMKFEADRILCWPVDLQHKMNR